MNATIPNQDPRYADSGRRRVALGGEEVWATLSRLKAEDARRHGATHLVSTTYANGARRGLRIEFEGVRYDVVHVADPKASDPAMRRRFLHLFCNVAPPA